MKNSAIYQYDPAVLPVNYIPYDYIKMAIENSSKTTKKKGAAPDTVVFGAVLFCLGCSDLVEVRS